MRDRASKRWWLAALAVTGCTSVEFAQRDSSFHPSPAARAPDLFVDVPPDRPFNEVGVIDVHGRDSEHDIQQRAREKGQQLGCQLVIAEHLVEHASAEVRPILVAHSGPHLPRTSAPPRHREHRFICGVYASDPGFVTPPIAT